MSTDLDNTALKPSQPFRTAVWRGLGVVLPPLLTIVIFFWIGSTVKQYAYDPVHSLAREALYKRLADIRPNLLDSNPTTRTTETPDGRVFVRVDALNYVPQEVEQQVRAHSLGGPLPETAEHMYQRYIEIEYLQPWKVIPLFLCLFVLVLYLLGKFFAVGVGRFFWRLFERGINRLPLVRNVYSSVKQVTDLLFSEREIEYTRVVAVEFPSKGIWSIGFVTSESLLDISAAANEPVLAVVMPYSPWSITGATITVRKSETIDLNISVDQALQFIVSCGVVVPPHQRARPNQSPLLGARSPGGSAR